MIISLSLSFLFIIIFLCRKYARMLIEYKYLLIEVIKLVREKEKKRHTDKIKILCLRVCLDQDTNLL